MYYCAIMRINFSTTHSWFKDVPEDPLVGFGKRDRNRVIRTTAHDEIGAVSHIIEPLSEIFLKWFTPMYNETISLKDNPRLFDLYATTIGANPNREYFSATILENDKPLGATIFSRRGGTLSIAYRILPRDWVDHKFAATPSFYNEYLIQKYAHEEGYKKISHGCDRNPYGPNANIGLAIFKLSVGSHPAVPSFPEIETIDSDDFNSDMLVFSAPESGRRIEKGYLITTPETEHKYSQLLKYEHLVPIEVIHRSN